jgi:membrane-associated protease RseP (regulator of RpoE activity)
MTQFSCMLAGVVVIGLLFSATAYGESSDPSHNTVLRGRWPDAFLLRGPSTQIGASFRDLKPAETIPRSLSVDGGVVIEQVRLDSPASRAGIRQGDRITMFDGQQVRNAKEFSRLVEETPPGWTVDITIVRDGQVRKLRITPVL